MKKGTLSKLGAIGLVGVLSGCVTPEHINFHKTKRDSGYSLSATQEREQIRIDAKDQDYIDQVKIYDIISKQTRIIKPEEDTQQISFYTPNSHMRAFVVSVNDKKGNTKGKKFVVNKGKLTSSETRYLEKNHNCLGH